MHHLFNGGTEVIQWLQSFGNPTLDAVFESVTLLGDERFYLLLIPFLYWSVNRSLAIHLSFVYLGSAYVNTLLKAIFALPRPSSNVVRVVTPAEGYAFPSGHAQLTSTVWSYLATRVQRAWFWIVASAVISLVAFSRLYLGVHYPRDGIAGIAIAIVLVAGYNCLVRSCSPLLTKLPLLPRLGLAFLVPLVLHLEVDTVSSMSTAWGLSIGLVLERMWVKFSSAGSAMKRAMRFIAGLVVLLALYFGLKAALPAGLLFRGLRYMLIGLWASLGAPWLFVKLQLAAVE